MNKNTIKPSKSNQDIQAQVGRIHERANRRAKKLHKKLGTRVLGEVDYVDTKGDTHEIKSYVVANPATQADVVEVAVKRVESNTSGTVYDYESAAMSASEEHLYANLNKRGVRRSENGSIANYSDSRILIDHEFLDSVDDGKVPTLKQEADKAIVDTAKTLRSGFAKAELGSRQSRTQKLKRKGRAAVRHTVKR